MFNVSLGKKRSGRKSLELLVVSYLLLAMPGLASASTLLPSQVLPPGTGKSCAPVTASEVMAYVYDGNLDSFDITLSDARYVALATAAGDQNVPFNYISRWVNPDGSVRMHVDLQSIQLDRDVKIQITFLSAQAEEGKQITCVFSIPATVPAQTTSGGIGEGAPTQSTTPVENPAESSTGANTTGGKPSGSVSGGKTPINSADSVNTTTNPGLVSASSSLGNLCANGGGGKLWVVLLVLYAIFTFTLCAQNFGADSSKVREWNIGLLLAVFAGLLVFWYMSAVCRTGPWAPAVATLIALAGLLFTMLKPAGVQQILLLRDGKK